MSGQPRMCEQDIRFHVRHHHKDQNRVKPSEDVQIYSVFSNYP